MADTPAIARELGEAVDKLLVATDHVQRCAIAAINSLSSAPQEPDDALNGAIDAIMAAEGALARAAGKFPDVGRCVIRAVIDVERGNLRQSRGHILSARGALQAKAPETGEE